MNVKDVHKIYKLLRKEFPPNGLLTPSLLQAIIDVLLMYEIEGDKAEGESHRERLNPGDAKSVCDSPNPDNKENQGDVEKSTSAKCAKCDFPPDNGMRRIYCICGQ